MQRVDFLVVGAGIAGLSAAARLVRHGSTLVIEAESAPGVHASGRSAAFAHFDMAEPLVRALTAASMPMFEEPGARVHPALFIVREGEAEALDRLETAYREWAPHVRRLSPDEMARRVPILRTGAEGAVAGLLDERALKLDADALLQGHRKQLKQAGGDVRFDAPLTALRHEAERWIADTPHGTVSAGTVVNAAGAWADRVAGLAGVAPLGLRPLRRTVIVFRGPEDVDVRGWPFVKTVVNGFYMEPEGTGRLLASPMDETEMEPGDAQPEELDIATAAWRVEQATTLGIRRIEHSWAGLRTFAPGDRLVAGFDAQAQGFFWLAGQGGFGLQTSPAMALAVEALATGGEWPEELEAVGVTAGALSPGRFGN